MCPSGMTKNRDGALYLSRPQCPREDKQAAFADEPPVCPGTVTDKIDASLDESNGEA